MIREQLNLEPTVRPAKSTVSIIAKLHREQARLSQIQDIAGCRLVVPDVREQDRVVASLHRLFATAKIVDRRVRPSHGYRAVHVLIDVEDRTIEIQVRTFLQQRWAEFSERLADAVGSDIKYGGGDLETAVLLWSVSDDIRKVESLESEGREDEAESLWQEVQRTLDHMIVVVENLKDHE